MKRTRPPVRSATRRLPLCMVIAAALATAYAPQARAVTRTWTGAASSGNWSAVGSIGTDTDSPFLVSNWGTRGAKAPSLEGAALVFSVAPLFLSNTNDYAGLSVSNLSFSDGAGVFTLGGNTLTLKNAAGSTITNSSSNRQTLNLGITVAGPSLWQGGSAGLMFNGLVTVADADLRLAGRVTIDNRLKDVTVGNAGTGSLAIEGASVVGYSNAWLGLNSGSNGTVKVTGAGSQLNALANLVVGAAGVGTMTLDNGGVVTSKGGGLGTIANGTGTVKVTGANSQWNSTGALAVGQLGTGSLTIEAGGVVSNTAGVVGANLGSNGRVTVSGIGSQWRNSSDLFVGQMGTGTLSVGSGGVVSNAHGVIGQLTGSSGTVTLTGAGSSWHNAGDLSVGYAGTGTLNVLAGAEVSNGDGYIGREGGPGSMATVSGAGARWATRSVLYVNNGSLVVREGGVASSRSAVVGAYAGRAGAVTVTGAGSQWNNDAVLYLGLNGSASLSMLDSGRVTTQALNVGALGTLNLGQGAWLGTSDGTTNGNTVNFTGDSSIAGHFTNNGRVLGSAGTLSFLNDVSGAGSYAGNVLFKAGYSPGNSPAAIDFGGGDVGFGSGSVLDIEVFGATPGAQYDQLLHINKLTFNGTLNLIFGNGYVPAPGSLLTLFDFASFSGSLSAAQITVSGYDMSKLDLSRLGIDGSLSVTAVPEPAHWALMLAGLAGLAWTSRRQRLGQARA